MSPWDIPVFRSAYFPIPHRPTFGAPVFRRAYWLRQTLRLQPLRGLHQSTLCFFFQNAHAPGSLCSPSEPRTVLPFLCAFPVGLFSVCAPNRLFKPLRCSAWLILRRSPTGTSASKTLMLQVRFAHPPNCGTVLSFLCAFLQNARPPDSLRSPSEPRTALPFLCAFPVGLFSVSAPNRLFKPLRCSAWLIQLRQRTALSPLKRSCSRFASLTLRTAHRPPVSLCFSPKRTTSRFASLSLRTPHRSPISLCFSPKRTTFRFASLPLRLRTEPRTALPFLLH